MSTGDRPELTRAERKVYYVDKFGTVRRYGSGRKRRSDYGTCKPHPIGCQHCQMVQDYRDMRAAECERRGGWRNEQWSDSVPTFKEWIVMKARDQHAAIRLGLIA